MKVSTKPARWDYWVIGPGGRPITIHSDDHGAGAWLELTPGTDHSLSLVSTHMGGVTQNYVGYRDGRCQADRVAISVDATGAVLVQVVVPGDGPEERRVRVFPLAVLEHLARQEPPLPQ